MVGRMVEKKGFEYAIQAISNINKMGMNPEVNIYGYGLLMKSLKERTRNLKVNGSIRFHGYQPIDSIMKAYDEHAIMIAPSVTAEDGNTEGLPNTILESMAKGTPVVASKHAAIPEVIKDKKTGFLFNEKDVDSLTELLRKILEDEFDLNSIRGNARSLIEKKYSVSRLVQEVEQIYDHVSA